MLIKNILFICLVSAMISCGNNNSSQPAKDTANTENENVSDIEMFKATDCATCHKKTETFVGPSFADIAERYPDPADTTIEALVQTIIKGSSGKWKTTVAEMPPHPAMEKKTAEDMVKYILEVKNKMIMYNFFKTGVKFIAIIYLLSCNTKKNNIASEPNTITGEQKKEGWQLLFDGKTTTGWHTFNKSTIGSAWKAEDGTIHLSGNKKTGWQTANGGDIIYEKVYKNFDLKIDWKVPAGGNSGIMFYSQEGPQYEYPWQTGIESQVLDNKDAGDAKIIKCKGGDLYDLVSCKVDVVKPAGEWNQLEIISKDGNLKLVLNGTEVISMTIWNDDWKKLIAATKFKDMPGFGMFSSGKIALQDEGNDVWYRNIMIKEL